MRPLSKSTKSGATGTLRANNGAKGRRVAPNFTPIPRRNGGVVESRSRISAFWKSELRGLSRPGPTWRRRPAREKMGAVDRSHRFSRSSFHSVSLRRFLFFFIHQYRPSSSVGRFFSAQHCAFRASFAAFQGHARDERRKKKRERPKMLIDVGFCDAPSTWSIPLNGQRRRRWFQGRPEKMFPRRKIYTQVKSVNEVSKKKLAKNDQKPSSIRAKPSVQCARVTKGGGKRRREER